METVSGGAGNRWFGRGLVFALALGGACDGGDDGTTGAVSADGTTTGNDDDDDDGTMTTLPTTVGQDTTQGADTGVSATDDDDDTGPGMTGSSSGGTGVETGEDTDTGSDSGSGSGTAAESSTGVTFELCDIELPPPGECSGPGATPVNLACNPITQDCPKGEKCVAFADVSTTWDATMCTPIFEETVGIGEACVVEGSGASGIDNCELGAMCWNVDVETLTGTCVAQCGCSYEEPSCEGETVCAITNEDSLAICQPVCNPLDPDACEDGDACYPVGNFFQCAPDASGDEGIQGDPCSFINVCDPGLMCAGNENVPGCAGSGCCTTLCHVEADDCPGGLTCTPFYAGGSAPDECSENFGLCTG